MIRLESPVKVAIASLRPADSPRLSGEDTAHSRMLADLDEALPPLVVHRPTMRVIDGMHRLRAATLRSQETIEVLFFDGPDDLAFVLAVEANVRHGLPLSLADREAAAARIIRSHVHWSDRAIAAVAGLAAKTVGAVRAQIGQDPAPDAARLGRDGKLRPLNPAAGRIRASQLIAERPNAPLRDIARAAGVSATTVRDVRDRMRRGEDPVPPKQRALHESGSVMPCAEPQRTTAGSALPGPDGAGAVGPDTTRQAHRPFSRRGPLRDRAAILAGLRRDPSLRFTDSGRFLLRWLESRIPPAREWQKIIYSVPPHCSEPVSEFARGCANDWLAFAEQVAERAESTA